MRKSRYSEKQINNAINASECGVKVKDICLDFGISEATFYIWKKKYSGLSSEESIKIKELEEKVKIMIREVQDLSEDKEMLQSVIKNSLTTDNKRLAVDFLQNTYGIGTRRSCRLLNISRSVYHYSKNSKNQ